MTKKLSSKIMFAFEAIVGYGIIGISYVYADAGGTVGGGGGFTIHNPLGSKTIIDVLQSFIGFLMVIAIPITVIMILVGAFQILTAGGKPEQFKKGTNTIMYAVIGLVVVLISQGLISLIEQLVKGT